MKKYCLRAWHWTFAIVLIFLLSNSSRAQGYSTTNWKFSNPQKFGFSVTDIDFADNNNVIAVGTEGGIAKSTDGGVTWTYGVFTYTTITGYLAKPSFSDVHYVTPSIAYAAGVGGVSSTSVFLGGVLAKTTDGGNTWSTVSNPLYLNKKRINTVWFVNQDIGYIAGEWNSSDSIPKVYFTIDGGANWDSLVSPSAAKTRIGYINNPNLAPIIHTVTGKGKEINRIMFNSANVGFVMGNASHATGSVSVTIAASAAAPGCLPTGGTTTSASSEAASLCWKFENGQLLDYSITKERLGFPGLPSGTIACNTRYASVTAANQSYGAMNMLSDSVMLLVSNTNNMVIRVYTGKNDSTVNLATGLKEPGRYEIMNMTNPPPGFPSVPAASPLFFLGTTGNSKVARAANGKIYLPVSSGSTNLMWTTIDTGRTWVAEKNLPTGRNYSNYSQIALDIAPNGKFLMGGTNGVMSDSTAGGVWSSSYATTPASASYSQIEFADCSNGIIAGSSNITVTTDGGKTWIDKARADFAASFYSIGGIAYPTASKAYFAVSNGQVYSSADQGTTLDPIYANFNFQMKDVAAIGTDSVWAVGQANNAVVPTASRKPGIFRSFDGGVTWTEYSNFFPGSNAQFLTEVEFPSRMIGYAAGSRDTIWKTTDAGVTWSKLPLPTPGVTPQITYTDMFALDDNNVFLVGNGFPRIVAFKTTDGGNTWIDITSNLATVRPESNVSGILFHDANNGYIAIGGGILKTTNGGASWTMDYAPSVGFNGLGFSPKKVPAAITFQNRKLFVVGPGSANILEYGNPANINVNSTETITNATCTNLTAGSITISASGAIAPYTYSIDGGAFGSSNVFNGLTQGPHTIKINDSYCGTLTKTITVGFTDDLSLTTNNDTVVCSGAPVQMNASTNGTGTTYAWTPAGGLSATNINNPIATVSSNSAYTVTATLNGCIRSKTVNIGIKPNPVISAGPDKTIVEGDEATLNGSGIANPVSIAWTPANTIVSGGNTYTAIAKPLTNTTYTLTVKNSDNCTSTDDVVITVSPYCIKAMNAFTPNGDGQNDKWLVTNGGCTKEIKVAVYNRYGNVIYTSNNYSNDWDGTYKGKPVADGTYYYSVTYQTITGKMITISGDVTILR